ncbi:MAG: hypothetical protein R3E79_49270 [Caldilineaceae bacterium]
MKMAWANFSQVIAQPIFHPVTEKVLPALPKVTVRSHAGQGGNAYMFDPQLLIRTGSAVGHPLVNFIAEDEEIMFLH